VAEKAKAQRNPGAMREHRRILGQAPSFSYGVLEDLDWTVFARLLNVSPKTVQSCEHGRRRPSQAALRLIQVVEQNPHGVFSVVGMSPPHESPPTKRENTASTKSGRRSQPRASKKPAV